MGTLSTKHKQMVQVPKMDAQMRNHIEKTFGPVGKAKKQVIAKARAVKTDSSKGVKKSTPKNTNC